MNGFDFVVIALVSAGAIYGLREGLLRMVTSAVALGAGLYVASVDYQRLAVIAQHQLGFGATAASIAGYVLMFAIVFAAVEIAGNAAIGLAHVVRIGWADRFAGSVLGAGIVCVVMGIAVMLLTAVLPSDAALLRQSRTAPILVEYDEMLIGYVPQQARDAYEANRAALIRYWIADAEKSVASAAGPGSSATPAASPGSSAASAALGKADGKK